MRDLNLKVATISTIGVIIIYNIYVWLRIFIVPDFINLSLDVNKYFGLYVFVTNTITIIIHIFLFVVIYKIIIFMLKKK